MELTVVVRKEGASYWSEVEQLPGCFASARTLDELAEALQEAVEFCLGDSEVRLELRELCVGDVRAEVFTRGGATP